MKDSNNLIPWFRLARLPNLLTVPGDPLAGWLLAAAACGQTPSLVRLGAAMGASLCLYIFGLILNDLMDLEIDRVERPERPLPSGQISVPQARMAAVAMALSGLNLALVASEGALYVAALLSALIILYNAWFKRVPLLGIATMGLCRGASLLLGGVAACGLAPAELPVPLLAAVLGVTVYVAGFSALARREMEAQKPAGVLPWLPFISLLLTLPAILVTSTFRQTPAPMLPFIYIFLMVMTLMRAWMLGGIMYKLQPVPATIGGHIRNLIMVQACLCVASSMLGVLPAMTLVLISIAFKPLATRFYSS